MDFIFDNGVIFIAIAIFIGRLILQLRRKGGEEAERPPARSPGFFGQEQEADDAGEEDEDEDGRIAYSLTRGSSDFLRELVMREAAAEAAPRPPPPKPRIQPVVAAPLAPKESARSPVEESRPFRAKPAGFAASLDRLSPLKRAVILAEILGPPKGL
jgi:hypothetical protein